jgi:hypothetical protein
MRIKRRINDQQPKTATMATLGKICIGEKTIGTNGKERPSALDYFRVNADDQYAKLFTAAYGERPTKIPIFFVSDDKGQSCPNFLELRDKAGKRVAKGDGEQFEVATKNSDGTVSDIIVRPDNLDKWMNDLERSVGGVWKEVLVLKFVIPNIPILGVWEFRTGGKDSSILNIVSTIDTVVEMAGRLKGIPFDLSVEIVKSDKSGSTSKYPVVSLVCNLSPESAKLMSTLPAGTFQVYTDNSIKELSGGEPTIQASTEIAKSETPITIDGFTFTDADSFTAAARVIGKMHESEHRKNLAIELSDKAQLYGFSWSKEQQKYI